MEINITWNICRVCLREESKENKDKNRKLQPIFREGNRMAKNILVTSGVFMKPNDGLPDKICEKCIKILKYAVYFRRTCQESNANLQTIIQRTKSASNIFKKERSMDILEEDIVDELLYDDEENEDLGQSSIIDNGDDGGGEQRKTTEVRSKNNDHKPSQIYKPQMSKTNENLNEKQQKPEKLLGNEVDGAEDKEMVVEEDDSDNNTSKNASSREKQDARERYENIKFHADNIVCRLLVDSMLENDDASDEYENGTFNEQMSPQGSNMRDQNDDDDKDLYYIINTMKNNDNENQNDRESKDECEDDHIDFAPVEDDHQDLQHELEENQDTDNLNDNQSYVTSTVVTKEEIDFDEENSNNSQSIDSEYIIDEYIIDECQSDQDNNSTLKSELGSSTTKNQNALQKLSKNIVVRSAKKSIMSMEQKHRSSERSLNNTTPNVCEICGNCFSTRQQMNIHMKIHRQEKTHECEICYKRFITACNLQAHMRTHTGEKPFECKYCNRRFADRSTHIRHERIHTNEKPFSCERCGKSFALATTLQAHLKVHTGERPYRCDLCSKSFKLAHQLKAHKNTSLHKAVEEGRPW
ncbi:uncharacterized protein LOC142220343 [Haematobia irritans]|uniref:uncharacterized protein LOC142220343 n=1 Tax=Haematobia irritans TaxID=7368 RepID=UPI003F5013E8